MKNVIRITALAVVLIMLCVPLFSCKEETETSKAPEKTGNDFYGYTLPDKVDYGGRKVGVLTTDSSKTNTTYQINPEDNSAYSAETAPATITTIAECARLVEEKLNIELEENCVIATSRTGGEMFQKISTDILTNTTEYLFCMPSLLECAMLAEGECLHDMNKIVDLKNPWWCQPFNDALTINGATYMIAGDIGMVSRDATLFVAFNKKMAESNHVTEKYGCKNLYEMVDKKLWTQDVMFEMAKSMYQDINQNNICDVGDINGLSGQDGIVYWLLKTGGEKICENDETGYPHLAVENERAISLIEQAQDYFQDPQNGFMCADDYFNQSKVPVADVLVPEFKADRCLFFMNALLNLHLIRDMESDFGILPCPMYDKDQDNYISNVGAWTSDGICVPYSIKNEEDLTLVRHVLECLGAISKEKLTPVYYDQTLQYQIVRDDDSMRMLDIIFNNRTPDMAETFRWGKMQTVIVGMRKAPKGSFVSAYKEVEDATVADIEETVEAFKKMQENG